MGRNFLNAFIGNSRFPGIKLLDRSARRFGIELTSRGWSASARMHVVCGGFCGRVSRAFGLDSAQRWGDRSAFGLLHLGIARVDGVLPVSGADGGEVSRGSFCPQG